MGVVTLSFDTSGGAAGEYDLLFNGGGVAGNCPSGEIDETFSFISGVGTSIIMEIRTSVLEIPTLRRLGLLVLAGLLAWTALRRLEATA